MASSIQLKSTVKGVDNYEIVTPADLSNLASADVSLEPIWLGKAAAITGTISSNAAVTVRFLQGPLKNGIYPVSDSVTSNTSTANGGGVWFDIKVVDTWLLVVFTQGTVPTTFQMSINISQNEG